MSEQQVVRFYTRARRIPFFLGKIGDFRLPLGPYTLTQAVAFVAVAGIGWKTKHLWADGWMPVLALVVDLAVAAGVGLAAGRVPWKGRNPFHIALGALGYAEAPNWGKRRGSSIAIPRTRRIRAVVSTPQWPDLYLDREADVEIGPAPEDFSLSEEIFEEPVPDDEQGPDRELVGAATSTGPTVHQLTAVQQLLAASAQQRR